MPNSTGQILDRLIDLRDLQLTNLSNNQILKYNSSISKWVNTDVTSSLPGGSDTQVQFNNSNVFGGSSKFTFNNTTDILYLDGKLGIGISSPTAKLQLVAGEMVFSDGAVTGTVGNGNLSITGALCSLNVYKRGVTDLASVTAGDRWAFYADTGGFAFYTGTTGNTNLIEPNGDWIFYKDIYASQKIHFAGTNKSAIVNTTGTGAFIARDTTTAGSAVTGFGQYVVDMQLSRGSTSHKVTGNYSAIIGGSSSAVGATYSASLASNGAGVGGAYSSILTSNGSGTSADYTSVISSNGGGTSTATYSNILTSNTASTGSGNNISLISENGTTVGASSSFILGAVNSAASIGTSVSYLAAIANSSLTVSASKSHNAVFANSIVDINGSFNSAIASNSLTVKGNYNSAFGSNTASVITASSGDVYYSTVQGYYSQANWSASQVLSCEKPTTTTRLAQISVTHLFATFTGAEVDTWIDFKSDNSGTLSGQIDIPTDVAVTFIAYIICRSDDVATNIHSTKIEGALVNDAGTLNILSSTATTIYDAPAFGGNVSVQTTVDTSKLKIQIKTTNSATKTYNASCRLELTEVYALTGGS